MSTVCASCGGWGHTWAADDVMVRCPELCQPVLPQLPPAPARITRNPSRRREVAA